jgi:hypothetical protein
MTGSRLEKALSEVVEEKRADILIYIYSGNREIGRKIPYIVNVPLCKPGTPDASTLDIVTLQPQVYIHVVRRKVHLRHIKRLHPLIERHDASNTNAHTCQHREIEGCDPRLSPREMKGMRGVPPTLSKSKSNRSIVFPPRQVNEGTEWSR